MFDPNLEVAILNRILNFILARGWVDYDNFSSDLGSKILKNRPKSPSDLQKTLDSYRGSFFKENGITTKQFVDNIPFEQILNVIEQKSEVEPLTFNDVFEEVKNIDVDLGKSLVSKLKDVEERIIQDTIQDSLRELNATNQTERSHDSVLEVADREHFSLILDGDVKSFGLVVKGYKSIKTKTVTYQSIIHQITRVYNRTKPDYILVVLAKNPEDSLISELVEYGKSVGNEYLVVLCDPVNLARFLKARHKL